MKPQMNLPKKYDKLNKERKSLNIRIDAEVHRKIYQAASDMNTSVQRLCEHILSQHVESLKSN